ncbi:hypothetical protein Acr_00g0071950 [Actinidia rufa]|uniref:Uncharacterized protein n=1 Tax=Actinidia rufa TaxID=165716 RepID=A0A7J0DTF5_9ERIC|nr:hypothetical protein Acr_00g0071950 [Actinidia rufa]
MLSFFLPITITILLPTNFPPYGGPPFLSTLHILPRLRVDDMVVQGGGGEWWTIGWLWKFREAGWTLEEVMVQGGGARF